MFRFLFGLFVLLVGVYALVVRWLLIAGMRAVRFAYLLPVAFGVLVYGAVLMLQCCIGKPKKRGKK